MSRSILYTLYSETLNRLYAHVKQHKWVASNYISHNMHTCCMSLNARTKKYMPYVMVTFLVIVIWHDVYVVSNRNCHLMIIMFMNQNDCHGNSPTNSSNSTRTSIVKRCTQQWIPIGDGFSLYISIISCRTPVWLKTAFTVLVQEGGGIGARLVRGKGK